MVAGHPVGFFSQHASVSKSPVNCTQCALDVFGLTAPWGWFSLTGTSYSRSITQEMTEEASSYWVLQT